MTEPIIEGLNNLPARPTLAYVNRVDLRIVQALEQAFSGRVAWLIDHQHKPGTDVLGYLHRPGVEGIYSVNLSRELLADRIHDKFKKGFHVVLITNRPTQARGSLADVPSRLLSYLDETALPVLPVYAAYSQEDVEEAFSPSESAVLYLRFMPQLRAGKALGARTRMAWMEAAADHVAAHPLLRDASLPRLLVAALMRHQDARLIDGVDDSTLTYRNLLALALMLATYLRKQTKDRRLGIILPPGKLSVIANLACLLAGISAVNINYKQDKAQAERQIRQAGVNRFLSEERFRRKISGFAWPSSRDLIYIDRELAEMGRAPFTFWRALVRFGKPSAIIRRLRLPASATPDSEVTLLFTAGTEGAIHAVPMSHRMLAASLLQLQNRLAMQPGQRVLTALPAYNMHGYVHGLLLPLLFGYDMVTYPSPRAALRLVTLLTENHVCFAPTSAGMVQSFIQLFAEENRKQLTKRAPALAEALLGGRLPELFTHLRYWPVGGSELTEAQVQRAQELFGVQPLAAYALTETAPLAALNLPPFEGGRENSEGMQPPTIPAYRRGSVGAPLPGIAVRITDVAHEGRILPPGSLGLIWLKGANIASRYLDEEEGLLHGQWYCTGDVGRVDEDGLLYVAGRRMRFSCIGGELIPHETLEQVLAQVYKLPPSPGKPRIAIVAVPDAQEGEQLILLSTVHKNNADYRYTTMRYNLMNMGYPEQWTPKRLIVAHNFKVLPTLPGGRLNYPFCFAGVCAQLKIPLPGQEE